MSMRPGAFALASSMGVCAGHRLDREQPWPSCRCRRCTAWPASGPAGQVELVVDEEARVGRERRVEVVLAGDGGHELDRRAEAVARAGHELDGAAAEALPACPVLAHLDVGDGAPVGRPVGVVGRVRGGAGAGEARPLALPSMPSNSIRLKSVAPGSREDADVTAAVGVPGLEVALGRLRERHQRHLASRRRARARARRTGRPPRRPSSCRRATARGSRRRSPPVSSVPRYFVAWVCVVDPKSKRMIAVLFEVVQ